MNGYTTLFLCEPSSTAEVKTLALRPLPDILQQVCCQLDIERTKSSETWYVLQGV